MSIAFKENKQQCWSVIRLMMRRQRKMHRWRKGRKCLQKNVRLCLLLGNVIW